ncbi:MAG: divergent PAP2 family protein [Candidatus Omnitrophota bacterium]
MSDFFIEIGKNKIIWITLLSWIVAQGIKIVIGIVKEKRFDFKWIVGTGGMPSAHSAGVTALAMCIGINRGFASPMFAITLVFALVIMFDAQGVRRSIGRQATTLNKLIEDIYLNRGVQEERFWELVGHTPIEVLVGAFLGIVIAVYLY